MSGKSLRHKKYRKSMDIEPEFWPGRPKNLTVRPEKPIIRKLEVAMRVS